MIHRLALFGLLALAACSDAAPAGDSASNDSGEAAAPQSLFQAEIAPLIATRCVTCHLTGQEAGNMSLVPDKVIATLVGIRAIGAPALERVKPGDPEGSYLMMKLEGTQIAHGGNGAQMPFGTPPLSPEQIAKVRQWIKQGAKP